MKHDNKETILVVAHPDDEILFYSSILEKIDKIIFCFNDIPGDNTISSARKKAICEYPLNKVRIINLKIQESKNSIAINLWKEFKNDYKKGKDFKSFTHNSIRLIKLLKSHIPKSSRVYTHNPWGEYGHIEHIQVFESVNSLKKELDLSIYVSSYFSNITIAYSNQRQGILNSRPTAYKTNKHLFSTIKKHYKKYGCWTWFNSYKLPEYESFYEIISNNDKNYKKDNFTTIGLNYIQMENIYLKNLKRIVSFIIPKFVINYLRRGRINNK